MFWMTCLHGGVQFYYSFTGYQAQLALETNKVTQNVVADGPKQKAQKSKSKYNGAQKGGKRN